MGKIFDALEKSKTKSHNSVEIGKSVDKDKNGRPKKENELVDDKVLTLKKKSDIPLNKSTGAEKYGKGEKQVKSSAANQVTFDRKNIDINLVTLMQPQSFEAEQFKMLRTNLLFPVSGEASRTIMITSAAPGEGKSFVAANLAISIAQGIQEHVLLMDCDIRLPSIHTQFGFADVPGLSEYLSHGKPVSSLILKTIVDKLSIIPGGKRPHNPSELMSSQKMSNLLKETKNRYRDRFIIIDSPPPTLTAEASAISRQVDGIIVVVEYGSTPRQMVSNLLEIVGKEKILGIILNKFDIKFSSYYGLRKYDKYYGA